MLSFNSSDIYTQTLKLDEEYKNGKRKSLLFRTFADKTFGTLYGEPEGFPKEIRIARSLPEMLRGDLSPARILRIEKPLTLSDGTPIWRASSLKGPYLRGLGFQNGDNRYPSSLRLYNPNNHFIIGGITGHGKSVLLDSLITSLAMEFPPWEVTLVLADAKIVGAKRYAFEPPPHITSIAATTDSEYILSVLRELMGTMQQWNTLFGNHGVDNLDAFRNKTGLCIPRKVIIADEFEVMFSEAGRDADSIATEFDKFARAGRNSGYILGLCSQSPGGIPPKTLNNITVRMALGCDEGVSEKILGNKAGAANRNQIGRLILNTTLKEEDNEHYIVPFIDEGTFETTKRELHQLGEELGVANPLSFYDENAFLDYNQFKEIVEKAGPSPSKLYLGEASFVYRPDDGVDMIKISLRKRDMENIFMFGPTGIICERFLRLIKYNIQAFKEKATTNVIASDVFLAESSELGDLGNYVEIRSYEDPKFQSYLETPYLRILMLEVENSFGLRDFSDESDGIFYSIFPKNSPEDTLVNRNRAFYILRAITQGDFVAGFRLRGLKDSDMELRKKSFIHRVVKYMYKNGFSTSKMTREDLPPIFNIIVGLDKMLGIGRDSRSGNVSFFKKVLQDSFRANITWIASASNVEELRDLKSVWSHYLLEGVTESQANSVGAASYPSSVGNVLAVLYTKESLSSFKFKKFTLEGETILNAT